MASITNSHYILLFLIFFTFIVFTLALDLSNVAAEAPDGLLPLSKKHVLIRNTVQNGQVLNIHCKSSEDDLGHIRLKHGDTWGFRFRVNMALTTRFRCHFWWYARDHLGHYSYWFDIFTVYRDDNPFGKYPICDECVWNMYELSENFICRINRDQSGWCFKMDREN
ncbi:putative plant self-incompatibility S1 [Arabidopsis thaliana]|uniref:S-protein homolog n=2 Tax=Arabidopsis TaxID=3701 RepID=Q2V3P0_ARATH|nr:Plant self-incompatibility protein S1 family [Arabidopsis thaliana]ACF88484.1 At3g55677 [Arabidopsis thaliana]AEE79421.1 Plant self-incompatibility protein S1 family [Arabidopsis thaliana]KAG7628647.1 Plant self-incompatibility S1 [Arabidopsis thaliana x Arabidopsis arenosa]|eukprot:NP_001030866.1 Plant self-incompatibility protein S1 family [Arabidopsis thaliana]